MDETTRACRTKQEEDRPRLRAAGGRPGWQAIETEHPTLGRRWLYCEGAAGLLFTENETNRARLYGAPSDTAYVKDAFHDFVIHGRTEAVNAVYRSGENASACRTNAT